jgi:hypothetical protein
VGKPISHAALIATVACFSTLFTATKRIVGRDAASAIACASAASFLLRPTNGFTRIGAIKAYRGDVFPPSVHVIVGEGVEG